MNGGDTSRSMIVISAPKGASLEMGEEEHGESVLKMDSTGRGKIKVFNCNSQSGVKEIELNRSSH